ncbi:hypothetical protein AB0J83_30945 [Actinoplanes sp. NPDC049596]|uniref:hypothetical protein n=1 Tax=unclassified Actinoplanes TaxID=2626549 RepID=UPI00341F6C6B
MSPSVTADPTENPTVQTPAHDELDRGPADVVDLEVGRLRLKPEAAAWLTDHTERFRPQGWDLPLSSVAKEVVTWRKAGPLA